MIHPRYSIIIPVYNRPQEIEELLVSLTSQSLRAFEVLVVEDGSTIRCDDVVDRFRDKLSIQYFFKPNSGPGPSRNYGFQQARGDYFVVFDSDCIIPPDYFKSVEQRLLTDHLDAWGGPDRAHPGFTVAQRAMGYTMSSVLTTGGIRGGRKHVGWFQPRSFNMGISREVFEKTGGFRFERFAEDIELSIRMKKTGFKTGLIPEAFVYHKRRTNFKDFYKQVYNFGRGRAMVGSVHPEEVKLTHWFPTVFIAGIIIAVILVLVSPRLSFFIISLYLCYLFLILIHALKINRSIPVAFLSVLSAVLQLWGYGVGFFKEWIKSYMTKK